MVWTLGLTLLSALNESVALAANPPVNPPPALVSVQTSLGKSACAFDHSDTASPSDFRDYYTCGTGYPLMIVVRQAGWTWQAVTQASAGSPITMPLVQSVENQGTKIFPATSTLGPSLFMDPRFQPIDNGSAAAQYTQTWMAMNLLDTARNQLGSHIKPRTRGSNAHESAWAALSAAGASSESKLEQQFIEADEITAKLSNGQSVHCSRGKYAPPSEVYKRMHYPDHGCEYYACSKVMVDGKPYDGLLYSPGSPAAGIPSITLSSTEQLGPKVNILDVRSDGKLLSQAAPNNFGDSPLDTMPVPPQLSQLANVIPQYFNPEWVGDRMYLQSRCNSPAITHLIEQENHGLENAKDILANTKTVQLVTWDDQMKTLMNNLVPVTDLPEGACRFDNSTYLEPGAVAHAAELRSEIPNSDIGTVTPEEAASLFKSVAAMNDIAFGYLWSGCNARAEIITSRLQQMGIATEKVWMTGDLRLKSNPAIGWPFHVAAVIHVKNPDGTVSRMVIDPSVSDRLLTVAEWASHLTYDGSGPIQQTTFVMPQDASEYQRATITFTSSALYGPNEQTINQAQDLHDALQENATDLKALKAPPKK